MKKMNFDNSDNEDDLLLIKCIKTADLVEASDQLTDTIVAQFLAYNTKAIPSKKPLKIPLILMLVLTALLLFPLILSSLEGSSFPSPTQEFYASMSSISYELQNWYLIYPMAFLLILLLFTHVEMRFAKSQHASE